MAVVSIAIDPTLVAIVAIIVLGVVVLALTIRKGRRIVAQFGAMHFELTANGGSASVKDFAQIAAVNSKMTNRRLDDLSNRLGEMVDSLVGLEDRVESLETTVRRMPPAA